MAQGSFELLDIGASLGNGCELSLDALEALEDGGVISVTEKLADLSEAVRSKAA